MRDSRVQVVVEAWQRLSEKFPDLPPSGGAEDQLGDMDYGLPTRFRGVPYQIEPFESVVALAQTPRAINQVVRDAEATWARLHGECSLKEVFALSCLKYCAPTAYDFLLENATSLQLVSSSPNMEERSGHVKALLETWQRLTEHTERDLSHAKSLITFLFPGWAEVQWVSDGREGLQGVRHSHPTDYLDRLTRGALRDEEVPDQEVLSLLRKYESGTLASDDVERLAAAPQLGPKLEHFGPGRMDGDGLRRLAGRVFDAVYGDHGVSADGASSSAFLSLWRMAIRSPIGREEHQAWAAEQVISFLDKSLRFSNSVYYYWRTNDEGEIHVKDPSLYAGIRRRIVAAARNILSHPSVLTTVLDPGYMYSSYHFCIHHSEEKQGGGGFRAEEWTWFGAALVEAARFDAVTAVPQIVGLLTDERGSPFEGFEHHLSTKGSSVFGTQILKAIRVVRNSDVNVRRFSDREQACFEFVRTLDPDELP